MFSPCLKFFAVTALGVLVLNGAPPAPAPPEICGQPFGSAEDGITGVLRVAADPNNLPFSNERGEGFENKLVELIARELHLKVEYTWRAQRRGFFRHTLQENRCDLVPGVPRGFEMALTSAPYYRSTYVAVTRRDRQLRIRSLDDPALRRLKIGVQLVGDDFMNTPPAHALSRRGLIDNVRGYTVYGDYTQENPPARIVDAVARGEIDLALVWGPVAGFFAQRSGGVLEVTPLASDDQPGALPFAFDICVGVRRADPQLRARVNAVLAAKRDEIDSLLASYAVPRAETAASGGPPQ